MGWTATITRDGDRWGYALTLDGLWHSGARNLRTHDAAQSAIERDKRSLTFDVPSIHEQLEELGL